MIKKNLQNSILILAIGLWAVGCSNQKNTFMSRQYHALTTHYNVYFNGKESLKEGLKKMERSHQENYAQILPVFFYQNASTRAMANGDMDRAIEKSSKAIKEHSITRKPKRKKGSRTEKYKEFRKKKEYNDWIDDCYLLMGKAYFFKKEYPEADKSFKFMLREYPDSELRYEAQMWLLRSMVDQGEFTSANEQLNRLVGDMPKDLRQELATIKADLFIRQQQYEDAIPALQEAISETNNKYRKARYRFILAQLYQESGQGEAASRLFQDLSKMSFSYEMTFNARIRRALSYTGEGNGEDIRKELNKMVRDRKNKEFRDQIYYALGDMDMKDGLPEQAIGNYWLSTQKSVDNDNQKALSFLRLGDYYFGKLNYKKSQLCYDSCMVYLSQDFSNYQMLSQRVGNLTELVNNLNVVERQDSLQNVARMQPKERDKLIAGIIKKIVEQEEIKRKAQNEAMQDRAFFSQNNMLGRNSQRDQNQGNWYFYNPTTVGVGKSDFQRKWGKRKLEDNWRRKNKTIVEPTDIEQELVADAEKEEAVKGKSDPKSREYYMADLPLTDSLIQVSNDKILRGLYLASLAYEEKLDNKEKAVETMEEMIRRFPRSSYQLSAYYHCYSNNRVLGNMLRAKYYKDRIVSEFAGSDYAHALTDPDFHNKMEAEAQKANRMYQQAYEDYTNYYYYRVVRLCDEALLKFPDSHLGPRFLFLKALGIGRIQDVNSFRRALQQVVESNPSEEIRKTVEAILNGIDQGAVPVQYTAADMENARQTRLLRNWRFDEPVALVETEPVKTKIEKAGLYQFKPAEEHYFVLLFNKKEIDPNRVLFNISRYNAGNINNRTFKVDRTSLNDKDVMVLVKGFKGKRDALEYFEKVILSEEVYSGLEDVDYRNFVISVNNYEVFFRNQDVSQYLDFYTQKYFNKTRRASTAVKKKGKLIATSSANELKDPFKLDPAANHKFVLVVPSRKVNINKLRADVYNHDKDFTVVKEPYDGDNQMIIVNNVGNRKEGMRFFQNMIADRNVYVSLEQLNYRNFIISDENFESFYVNKRLLQYMDFFRKNYLSDKSAKAIPAVEKVLKDGLYTYSENDPHLFGLIYSRKGVNSKILESGIKKYNTKNLKVEVRELNKTQNILLVTNMRNKKQAMMYFRAIVTNRNLFEPVDKVDYRNFVISAKNLEVFLKEVDIKNYMDFFKKYYLQ